MNKQELTRKNNITITNEAINDRYSIITTYHLTDKRLSLEAKAIFTYFLTLNTDNFKITLEATSKLFRLSKPTFLKYIKELKKYGYITTIKSKNNFTHYIIHKKPKFNSFDVNKIKSYTINELERFTNDRATPKEYLELIKQQLQILKTADNEINKLLEAHNIVLNNTAETETADTESKEFLESELPF